MHLTTQKKAKIVSGRPSLDRLPDELFQYLLEFFKLYQANVLYGVNHRTNHLMVNNTKIFGCKIKNGKQNLIQFVQGYQCLESVGVYDGKKYRGNQIDILRVTDGFLRALTKFELRVLLLLECEQITDAGLAHLRALPLTCLDLHGCRRITDAGLAHLRTLPLNELNLGSSETTDAGLAYNKKVAMF